MATLCIRPNLSDQKYTLYDRISKLLDSVEWSDVTFLVGNQVIKAHKLILATSSPVFQVMLYGPMAENTEIRISDIEPEIFQLLLDFIYKDTVIINCLENASGLLYASKKYMLPYLTDMCVKYIKSITCIINVMSVYKLSEWLQEESLMKYSLAIICRHANIIFKNYFQQIPARCLLNIIQESAMNITEKELIEACWLWSHNQCLENGIIPTNNSKRQILLDSGVYNYLRFLALSDDDYDWIKQLGVLTKEQSICVDNAKTGILIKTPVNFTFNTKNALRLPIDYEWLVCRRPVLRSAPPLVIANVSQSMETRFKCEKTIFVGSVFIPSRQSNLYCKRTETNNYLEDVIVTLTSANRNDECIAIAFNQLVDYNTTILIQFPKPFMLDGNQWYTFNVFWPNKLLHKFRYSLCYRPLTVSISGTLFHFDDISDHPILWGSLLEGLTFSV